MAGYISRKSADRWNRAAGIVEGGGAGSHFVQGLYRPPKQNSNGVKPCEDLQPGSYPAVAGATIEPGATGQILITTCDSSIVIGAINHTNCTFYAGELITAIVDECCIVRFTGCKCDCGEPSTDCCDRTLFICVDGRTFPISMKYGRFIVFGFGTFNQDFSEFPINPSACCTTCAPDPPQIGEGFTAYTSGLHIYLTCDSGTITALATYVCAYSSDTIIGLGYTIYQKQETYDWSALCGDNPVNSITETFEYEDCSFDIVASFDLTATCDRCEGSPPPPASCCDKSLYFCINGDSRLMSVSGGDQTWDVSDCCDCTTATVRLVTSCGNGQPGVQATYTCDGVSSITFVSLAQFCGTTNLITFPISTLQCFIPVQVSVANVGCDACDYCCDETRWFCINGISKEMTLAGDSNTFDVTDCCDCETSTLTLAVSCIGSTNTLRFDWSITCGGSIEPISGFDFLSCNATVLNITVNQCFYQVQISETNIGCAECEGGGTTITTPPPPEEPPPPGP